MILSIPCPHHEQTPSHRHMKIVVLGRYINFIKPVLSNCFSSDEITVAFVLIHGTAFGISTFTACKKRVSWVS